MKAVIFDRDGVIINSEFANVDSSTEAFKQLGIEITKKEKEMIVGRHAEDYAKIFLKKYTFSPEKFKELHNKFYRELIETTPFFDKTISLIKRLHKSNITLALTTSADKEGTLKILARGNLINFFKIIVTDGDYANRKPSPEPYLVTAKKLNLDPKDCIVIEDSEVGVESAKAAGMKCIALPNDYSKNQNFSKADIILDSADKITLELLNKL